MGDFMKKSEPLNIIAKGIELLDMIAQGLDENLIKELNKPHTEKNGIKIYENEKMIAFTTEEKKTRIIFALTDETWSILRFMANDPEIIKRFYTLFTTETTTETNTTKEYKTLPYTRLPATIKITEILNKNHKQNQERKNSYSHTDHQQANSHKNKNINVHNH
jgi:hypothetical protein